MQRVAVREVQCLLHVTYIVADLVQEVGSNIFG